MSEGGANLHEAEAAVCGEQPSRDQVRSTDSTRPELQR